MSKLIIVLAMSFLAFPALATTTCDKHGGGYKCDKDGKTYIVPTATSVANAISAIDNHISQGQGQDQSQGQGQSQSSDNSNSNVNGGNSVNIEGDPALTASFGVGVNFDIPIGGGIQAASCRETVRLAREMGYETVALQIFLECPHVRKLNLTVNPGDKG